MGRVEQVLVEGSSRTDESLLRGRTRRNTMVNFTGDARAGELRELRVIERAAGLRWVFVPGENRELRRVIAMRHGNARIRRRGNRRGDAGNHFKSDTSLRKRFAFFAAASEDEGVAAFKANHYLMACVRLLDQQLVDFVLR